MCRVSAFDRLVLALLISLVVRIRAAGFDGIPGEYCSIRTPTCCPSRNDQCTVPILGNHLCYCDMFCDRGQHGNDCCPDFRAVCKLNPAKSAQDCSHDGITYGEDDVIKKNCNKCQCTGNQWRCGDAVCLIQEDVLVKVQNGRFTWTAKNYSQFWGRTLEDGIKHRLGTLFPERSVQNMNEILIKPRELPTRFDAREKWPDYIHGVQDQGDCASSWSQSTTATSADRLAIITDGRQNADLSAQQLLSCNQHRQRGCEGGYLDRAWWYIRKLGVVSDECYPYLSGNTGNPEKCFVPKSEYHSGRPPQCPSGSSNNQIYRMTPSYRVSSKEVDIMTEILTNGPVQATFLVHEDFFMYSGGVYQRLSANEETAEGYHSVRLIGWGVDESTGIPVKYWIAANSWGPSWGESGLFRIVRGQNHCEIESFVIGAWGKGAKRRRYKVRKLRQRTKQFRFARKF